jgi:hypothetical protein
MSHQWAPWTIDEAMCQSSMEQLTIKSSIIDVKVARLV